MNPSINPLTLIRLEKAAVDCGFELTPKLHDDTMTLCSAQFPETIQVDILWGEMFVVRSMNSSLTVGQKPDNLVNGYDDLYEVLARAAATARTMPNRVAQKYLQATASLPRSTESERLVIQRVGQDLFRNALLDYWRGSCCITGLAVPGLLRASHIKPWAGCETDEERLDVFNGLLLAPHLDALFDGGWMTVGSDGEAVFSSLITAAALKILGVPTNLRMAGLTPQHHVYLDFHRKNVFNGK